jgi:urease gamma subunit
VTGGEGHPAVDLRGVRVRLCCRDELVRFRELLRAHHYLGFRGVVGESVAHVAEGEEQWLALLLWAAAAMKCAARDAWIGWHPAVAWQRLHLVANNVRFLILPGVQVPNLASRVLGLSVRRLSDDWRQIWGHPLVLGETFVDPARYAGTCYRAAGWVELGQTRGFARHSGGWSHHGKCKVILVRELIPGARELLSDPRPAVPGDQGVAKMKLRPKEIASLMQVLKAIPDPRKRRGIRHSKTSMLAIVVAAVLSGVRSVEGIAQWARECTQDELVRLGIRRNQRTKRFHAPSEPAFRRLIQRIDADAVDRHLSAWLIGLGCSDAALAIDGKTVRGARRPDGTQVHLLSAVLHSSGITVAQCEVDSKSNEIPAAAPLLAPLDLSGRCVTADAMHTQREFARFVVEDKHADYALTVKDNQPTLKADIDTLFDLESFPPSASND